MFTTSKLNFPHNPLEHDYCAFVNESVERKKKIQSLYCTLSAATNPDINISPDQTSLGGTFASIFHPITHRAFMTGAAAPAGVAAQVDIFSTPGSPATHSSPFTAFTALLTRRTRDETGDVLETCLVGLGGRNAGTSHILTCLSTPY